MRTPAFLVPAFFLVLAACGRLPHLQPYDAGVTDAGPADAALVVDATDAATDVDATVLAAPLATTAAPVHSAAPVAGKGDCWCLPDQGTTVHGSNQRLAPTWRQPTCGCDASGVPLCQQPAKTCKARTYPGAAGAACQGWDSTGKRDKGVLECEFASGVDTYPRPAGASCTGFTVDHKSVKGHVFCR